MELSHRIFSTEFCEKWAIRNGEFPCGFVDILLGEQNHIYIVLTKEIHLEVNEIKEFCKGLPLYLGLNPKSYIHIYRGAETEIMIEPE